MTDQPLPGQPSDEADTKQLRLARTQGDAYGEALEEMTTHEADTGGTAIVGDYEIGFAAEEAEGMYEFEDGQLVWHNPATDENVHIEIAVRDRRDGRFIPYLDIDVTLTTADGAALGTHRQPFMWHSWLYHYGRNWTIPGNGTYNIHVKIAAPTFMRHDHGNGARYAQPVEHTFENIELETGQKTI